MIYIGTSGWSYAHWQGVFYPQDWAKNQWLSYYSQHFNTVELNMSFYRYPFQNMLKGWVKKIPEDFQMTFKAHRQITHRKRFHEVGDDLQKFYQMTNALGDQTGCILFQVPPGLHKNPENVALLRAFLEQTEAERNNVIEFRHPSWWCEETRKLLADYQAGFVVVSGLNMPSTVIATSQIAYFRFHGPDQPYASKYSDDQLKSWAESIQRLTEEGRVKQVYCYFNNDLHGYAIEDAKALEGYLQEIHH